MALSPALMQRENWVSRATRKGRMDEVRDPFRILRRIPDPLAQAPQAFYLYAPQINFIFSSLISHRIIVKGIEEKNYLAAQSRKGKTYRRNKEVTLERSTQNALNVFFLSDTREHMKVTTDREDAGGGLKITSSGSLLSLLLVFTKTSFILP